jgi:hypothetical protein
MKREELGLAPKGAGPNFFYPMGNGKKMKK